MLVHHADAENEVGVVCVVGMHGSRASKRARLRHGEADVSHFTTRHRRFFFIYPRNTKMDKDYKDRLKPS